MNMQHVQPIEIKVPDRASMDRCITAAVERMIECARRQRTHGILVTRLGDGHFVVGLSSTVPFGDTHQLDFRRQTARRSADAVPALPVVQSRKRQLGDTPKRILAPR
jgi:predicted amino acid dehydrogenase